MDKQEQGLYIEVRLRITFVYLLYFSMKNFLLGLTLVISSGAYAQSSFLSPHSPKAADAVGQVQKIIPDEATYYAVDVPSDLGKFLQGLPAEGAASDESALLDLPGPDGAVSTFRLTRYQMITDELQARYPNYVTAYGWDVDAPNRKVYLEWTALGLGASVTGGTEGRWYISPQFHARQDLYQAYYTRNYPLPDYDAGCGFSPDAELQEELAAFGPPVKSVGDCQLREYDLALACTGEYYAAVGGTEALVVAEMMTAINRVNGVFHADLAITLKLINLPVAGGGIQLVYNNPVNDPYTNANGSTMLGENQTTVDNVIGSANYDIGHVFSTGGGGIASLGSPCSSSRKAQGVTGLSSPTGDPFYIDFVAHEIGHQFGGNHTFNSTNGNCGTRNTSTAYEPGGGTTIQAYAGICGSTANIQMNSDPYYHAVSIQEISAYMELGGGATCATTTSTANTAPTVSAGSDYTIPANTPFVLTAENGADPNGDALTYCWEQFDLGPVVAGIPTGSETQSPLFRSLPPVTSPERYFPNLPELVASGGSQWEVLPTVARNMTFIVTIRDNGSNDNAMYGCTVQDQMDVTVVTSTGFAVTAPNGGDTWNAGTMETVTWNVAGTGNGTTVDCEMVELVLSTNGGLTFDQSLGTFPNTGTANVTAPTVTETDARIMVRGDGNIFFDVGDADFSIEQTDYSYTVTGGTATACNGTTTADFSFEVESLQGYTGTINYTAANLPAGATIAFTPASATLANGALQAVDFTLSNLGSIAAGDYTFQIITNDGSGPKSEDYALTIESPLAAPTLISPANNGATPANNASFTWSAVPGATGYHWVLCRNANCTSFVDATTTNTGVTFDLTGNGVSDGDMLTWFVEALDNTCEPDAVSPSGMFNVTFGTAPPSGNSLSAGNSPISFCEGSTTDEEFTVSFTNGDLTGPASLSVTSQPVELSVLISPITLSNNETATISFTGEEALAPGDYTITIQAADGTNTEDIDLTLRIDLNGITVNSPADGEEVLLTPNGGCGTNLATFIDFNFSAYTGGGTVVGYSLFRDVVGGGSFPERAVSPGSNVLGLCLEEGEMVSFYIEAELSDGSTVRSCDRIFTATENPLPVEWLSFTAEVLGKTSLLNWSVIQDESHRAFTIERSMTGRGDWLDLTRIERVGADGAADYSYTDRTVTSGTYFYRLRQEDVDGTTDNSVVRLVTFTAGTDIVAFPNPVADWVNVQVSEAYSNGLTYQLINPLGQQVAAGVLTTGSTRISVADFPTAVYQLVVTDGGSVLEVLKIVKR